VLSLFSTRHGSVPELAGVETLFGGRRGQVDAPVLDPAVQELGRSSLLIGSMSGLSLALGPILSGALVDGFGWRSIFWINVPIVAAAIVCTALFVPESRAAGRAGSTWWPDPGDPYAGQRRLRDHRVQQVGLDLAGHPRPARRRRAQRAGHPRLRTVAVPARCWSCAYFAACRSARRS
jgi:MFS family permease